MLMAREVISDSPNLKFYLKKKELGILTHNFNLILNLMRQTARMFKWK